MRLETLAYSGRAWSRSLPALDSEQTLVCAFGAPGLLAEPACFAELAAAYPRALLLGCSTAGEIHQDRLEDDSLSVAVARFDSTPLRGASLPIERAEDSHAIGRALARELCRDDLRAIFVLCDGLHVNGSELVRGINEIVPASVTVTGGLAGDGPRFQHTWVLDAQGPREGLVTAVGFYGHSVVIGHGSRGGWDHFGPARRITRSKANVLMELDGRPALQIYKDYLGERAAELPASALLFPLAVRAREKDQDYLVRTILSIDEERQSMTFAGDLPEGHLAQLMRANFERLIEGASGAAQNTLSSARPGPGSDMLSIAISCVGRRLILGERAEEELEATLAALPTGARQIGFYSYGEISPAHDGRCGLHNQTMTITTLSEG